MRGFYTEKDASVCVKEMLDAIKVSNYYITANLYATNVAGLCRYTFYTLHCCQ